VEKPTLRCVRWAQAEEASLARVQEASLDQPSLALVYSVHVPVPATAPQRLGMSVVRAEASPVQTFLLRWNELHGARGLEEGG